MTVMLTGMTWHAGLTIIKQQHQPAPTSLDQQYCIVFTRSPADAGHTHHKNTTTLENRAGTGDNAKPTNRTGRAL